MGSNGCNSLPSRADAGAALPETPSLGSAVPVLVPVPRAMLPETPWPGRAVPVTVPRAALAPGLTPRVTSHER